jgi:hypothetical protein
MTVRRYLPPVLAVTVAAVAAPARADTTIATVAQATPVTAYGDDVVWSAQAETGQGYRLIHRGADGVVAPLPVPGRSVPFDADLGPGEDGRSTLVYSRCAVEPPAAELGGALAWNLARRCDVYRFSFTTGREARIAGAASPAVSEFLPAVWRGRVAFAVRRPPVRRPPDPRAPGPALGDIVPGLRLLERGGAVRTLPGPSARACARVPGERAIRVRRCGPVYFGAMTGLDLRARAVAFAWQAQPGDLPSFDEPEPPARFDVFVSTSAGRRLIAGAMPGGRTQVVPRWPAFDGEHLTWSEGCFGDQRGCPGRHRFWRYRLADGSKASAAAPRLVVAQAATGGRFTYLRDADLDGPCADGGPSDTGNLELRQTGRIEFERWDPRRPPPRAAAPRSSWPAGQALGRATRLSGAPELAITPRGDTLALWNEGRHGRRALRAAVRSARDTRFRVARAPAATRWAGIVRLVATPQNQVIAAWTRLIGRNGRIQAATWSTRGRFGPVRTLSGPNVDASLMRLVVNRRGDALLAWREGPSAGRFSGLALRPAGGSFARVEGAPDRMLDAALGDDGTIVVASGPRGATQRVRVAERSPLGTWNAPQTLDAAPELWGAAVAIARGGTAVVAWLRSRDGRDDAVAATRSPGGAFGAPVTLSEGRVKVAAVAERDGAVTLAWVGSRPAGLAVEAATWSSTGGFSRPRLLSPLFPRYHILDFELTALPGGGSAASWDEPCLGHGAPVVALRRPGRGFSAGEHVASIGTGAWYPHVAAGGGRIGVAWSRRIGSRVRPEATLRTLPR